MATENDPVSISDGLTDTQRQAARLAALGMSGADIARELDCRPESVSRWHRNAAWTAARDTFASEAHAATVARLNELAGVALDELEELLRYRHSPQVRLRAASELLRLAGAKAGIAAQARLDAKIDAIELDAGTGTGD